MTRPVRVEGTQPLKTRPVSHTRSERGRRPQRSFHTPCDLRVDDSLQANFLLTKQNKKKPFILMNPDLTSRSGLRHTHTHTQAHEGAICQFHLSSGKSHTRPPQRSLLSDLESTPRRSRDTVGGTQQELGVMTLNLSFPRQGENPTQSQAKPLVSARSRQNILKKGNTGIFSMGVFIGSCASHRTQWAEIFSKY